MSSDAYATTRMAADLIDEAGGFGAFIRDYGMGGIFLALVARVIEMIDGFGAILIGIPSAFGRGFIGLIDTFFLGMENVFGAGTATAVESLTNGLARWLGPLAQPASAGVALMTVFLIIWVVSRLNISPWAFISNVRG